MKRPLTVKIAIGLGCFKIATVLLVIITYYLVMDKGNSTSPVIRGIKAGFDNAFELTDGDPHYNFGVLIGTLTIPLLLTIGTICCIHYRKFIAAVVFVSLEIIAGLAGGMPFLPIAVLILICINPARIYLQNKQHPSPPIPPTDQDISVS